MLRKHLTPAVKAEAGHIWSLLWPIAVSNALLMLLQVRVSACACVWIIKKHFSVRSLIHRHPSTI